jgi:hypothetical protein
VRRVAHTTQKCGRRPSFKGRFLSPRAKHKSSNSQLPHHRELKTDDDATVLVAATVSGGGLYAFAIGATVEQWAASEAAIRAAHKSFSVAATEESSMDLSERIYSACIESGRKAAPLSLARIQMALPQQTRAVEATSLYYGSGTGSLPSLLFSI